MPVRVVAVRQPEAETGGIAANDRKTRHDLALNVTGGCRPPDACLSGPMTNRPIAIALAASALYSGVLVATAHAEMHYVRVTLVTGQQLTVTVEVPPGTPASQAQIPG